MEKLEALSLAELKEIAKEKEIKNISKLKKDELRENIGIVNERVEVADRISADSFINVRKTKTGFIK